MLSTNASGAADELIGEFEEFEEEFQEERDRALIEAQQLAKRRAPVDTGRLRDSVSVDLQEDVLFSDVEYAPFVEFGTIYMDATHFMGDSARDAFQNSLERLRR
mgnify:CR=1 FL=1